MLSASFPYILGKQETLTFLCSSEDLPSRGPYSEACLSGSASPWLHTMRMEDSPTT